MDRATAETIALQALAFIAADERRLGRMMAETGIAPESLRAAAEDASALGGILEFLLSDEAILTTFCTEEGFSPDAPGRAFMALPGGRPLE